MYLEEIPRGERSVENLTKGAPLHQNPKYLQAGNSKTVRTLNR